MIDLVKDSSAKTGYVSVTDRFGDYGIIGFFAYKNMRLQHFLFSCRTLGMGIEQYVYACLDFPEIELSGEAITDLKKSGKPSWINNKSDSNKENKLETNGAQVLFKGPCDLEQIFSYIDKAKGIDTEFTYINEKTGVSIEQYNHTSHIVESLTLKQEAKEKLIEELPFSDKNMFSAKMFNEKYDVVFLSMLTDGNLGIYKRKDSNELIAFGEYYYSLTNPDNWEGYIDGTIFNANCNFTVDSLKEFSNRYEFMGRITVQKMIDNLSFIRNKLNPETLLVLMIGSETEYEDNNISSYENRHLIHKEQNEAIRVFAKDYDNLEIIDFNNYIKGQASFFNNINHFIKPVYYNMAKDIIKLINLKTSIGLQQESRLKVTFDYFKQLVKKVLGRA